jgi:cytochrome c peroxidase
VDLAIGASEQLFYFSSSGDLVRASVEPAEYPSSCFASLEIGAVAFQAGLREPLVHPADHGFATYIPAGAGDRVRLSVYRREPPDASCRVSAQLADDRGTPLVQTATLAPGAGKVVILEATPEAIGAVPGGQKRVLIDLLPIEPSSALGCVAAAYLLDPRGNVRRVVPLSIPRTPETAAAPPPRTRTAAQRSSVGASIPIGTPTNTPPPRGLPRPVSPPDNPQTFETAALGRRLFYETRLSRDGTESCASCHDPTLAFRDPRTVSQGVNGLDGDRQSMTILNAAFVKELFWDGRAKSLEEQALGPVDNPVEFAFSHRGVEQRLELDPSYVAQFAQAFGAGDISYDKVAKSIAAFQRTALSGNSLFDRNALSPSAQRGFSNGFNGGRCNLCHKVDGAFASFGDDEFHNTGIAASNFDELSDQGRWKVTGRERDRGAFRPPTPRNVTRFPRLMHNGRFGMSSALENYGRGGVPNRWLSSLMVPLGPAAPNTLSELLEFLEALVGEWPEHVGPPE